jgi:hypothetical protein
MKQLIWLILIICSCLPALAQDQGESGLLLTTPSIISYTGVGCATSATSASASCTLSAAGAVGDLLIINSKASSSSSTASAAVSFSGTAPCASTTTVIAPSFSTFQSNGGGFIAAMYACIITTASTATPKVTWTGGNGFVSSITVATYHTGTSWKTTFVDQTNTNVSSSSLGSCSTGTTSVTTNAVDLVVAICMNADNSQTWRALAGFTNRAASSLSFTGWYDRYVSTKSAQTALIPFSSADYSVGMIAAFASN